MASDGTLIDLEASDSVDPIRVLLADDEPGLRTALTELLSHEDRVELIGTAADAEEAIRLAESDLPDVALIDVRMPEGGGPHAARGISRVYPGTRVIALSACEDRRTSWTCSGPGPSATWSRGRRPTGSSTGSRRWPRAAPASRPRR